MASDMIQTGLRFCAEPYFVPLGWHLGLVMQAGLKRGRKSGGSTVIPNLAQDLCSYLKDVEAKTDADCGQEAFAALNAKAPAAYGHVYF